MISSVTMKKFLVFFLIILASCAHKETIYKPIAFGEDIGRKQYNSLEQLYNEKKYESYINESSLFVKQYPQSKYAPDIFYKRGLTLLELQRNQLASKEFYIIINSYAPSKYYGSSLYHYVVNEYRQGNFNNAISVINRANLSNETITPSIRAGVFIIKGKIYSESNDIKALEAFMDAYKATDDLELKSKIKSMFLSQVEKQKIGVLEKLAKEAIDNELLSYVKFSLAEQHIQKGDVAKAKEVLVDFISSYPQHEYLAQAESYLSRLQYIDKVAPYTIGVVLPLTGRNALFGQKALMGIQFGSGIFGDKNNKLPIKLSIKDSQSDAEIARVAVEDLLQEDHVIAIIGPLGSDEAETVAMQSSMYGIPNINLSQKEELPSLGDYVFRMAMSNKNQIKRLVDYAMGRLSLTEFGIMYPEDKYGQELSKYFWDEVIKKGGKITAIESYEVQQSDFREQVRKLLGIHYIGTRMKEYNELKEALETDGQKRIKEVDLTLPPLKSFEALFIPDDAKIATQIASYLPYYGAKGIILMGPNTWNSPQLINRGQANVNGAIFVDGFTPLTVLTEGQMFIEEFKKAFNTTPGILEAQGNDSVNLLIDCMSSITSSNGEAGLNRKTLRDCVSNKGRFSGATGRMTVDNSGEIDKELFVLGVERGKIILKD